MIVTSLTGWPPYVDCESLKELFSRAGHVTDVILQLKGGPVEDVEESEGFKVLICIL